MIVGAQLGPAGGVGGCGTICCEHFEAWLFRGGGVDFKIQNAPAWFFSANLYAAGMLFTAQGMLVNDNSDSK